MSEKPVELPSKATPLGPGDPVEMPGSLAGTFAERRKAREAREKAVQAAENKAVKSAATKKA